MANTPAAKHGDITTLADLTPQRRNARKRTPANLGMIEASLREVGAARSIVIDEDGQILAGNGTVEAAGICGMERVRVVDADGDEIIAVRRTGLTDRQKVRLALYDNRAAELAEWDTDVLAEIGAEELAGIVDPDGIMDAEYSDPSGDLSMSDVCQSPQISVQFACLEDRDRALATMKQESNGKGGHALGSALLRLLDRVGE